MRSAVFEYYLPATLVGRLGTRCIADIALGWGSRLQPRGSLPPSLCPLASPTSYILHAHNTHSCTWTLYMDTRHSTPPANLLSCAFEFGKSKAPMGAAASSSEDSAAALPRRRTLQPVADNVTRVHLPGKPRARQATTPAQRTVAAVPAWLTPEVLSLATATAHRDESARRAALVALRGDAVQTAVATGLARAAESGHLTIDQLKVLQSQIHAISACSQSAVSEAVAELSCVHRRQLERARSRRSLQAKRPDTAAPLPPLDDPTGAAASPPAPDSRHRSLFNGSATPATSAPPRSSRIHQQASSLDSTCRPGAFSGSCGVAASCSTTPAELLAASPEGSQGVLAYLAERRAQLHAQREAADELAKTLAALDATQQELRAAMGGCEAMDPTVNLSLPPTPEELCAIEAHVNGPADDARASRDLRDCVAVECHEPASVTSADRPPLVVEPTTVDVLWLQREVESLRSALEHERRCKQKILSSQVVCPHCEEIF